MLALALANTYSEGSVEILTGNHAAKPTILGVGHFMGEIALVTEGVRTASIRALEYVELAVLSKKVRSRSRSRFWCVI